MCDFAAVTIHKDPLGQDVGLRVVLPDFHASLHEVEEEGIKFLDGHFSNQLGFTERRPFWFFIHHKVVALFLENLYHFGGEFCLAQKLETGVGE